MMAGIRGKNTKPELAIRHGLHRAGFRYRLHAATVPGKPDMVFPRHMAVIFVHGCFWHGHDCELFRLPGTRTEFWQEKITANRNRDRDVAKNLEQAGWRQGTVWECALRGKAKVGLDVVIRQIVDWLPSDIKTIEIRG